MKISNSVYKNVKPKTNRVRIEKNEINVKSLTSVPSSFCISGPLLLVFQDNAGSR